ncbi:hypothetical protein B0J14DRAFT_591672 [Halenospora varia]|nr:hypothetical protein B0J14DRAFT_591672 [Halenospora varia]
MATPSLEDDMKNFPEKSRGEVKQVRCLWKSGMLELGISQNNYDFLDEDDWREMGSLGCLVPRTTLCSFSTRFQELFPTKRSWPKSSWEVIAPSLIASGDCYLVRCCLELIYKGKLPEVDVTEHEFGDVKRHWDFGVELGCPRYQNTIISILAKKDERGWNKMVSEENDQKTASAAVAWQGQYNHDYLEDLTHEVGAKHQWQQPWENSTLEDHKLLSYLKDKLVWDAFVEGGEWLTYISYGGLFATVLAKSKMEAAKSPPEHPPWHKSNLPRYLVAQGKAHRGVDNLATEKTTKQDNGRDVSGTKRKRDN